MTNFPERIAISPVYRQKRPDDFYLVDQDAFPGRGVEYVRADRIEELQDHLRMAMADKEAAISKVAILQGERGAALADSESLEKQNRELALQVISDQGQAIDAYEAQKEAEAKLEKAVDHIKTAYQCNLTGDHFNVAFALSLALADLEGKYDD